MDIQQPTEEFTALVASSETERSRVRTLIREGKWREAEPDSVRRDRYRMKEKLEQKENGQESIQGTTDWLDACFFTEGSVVQRAVGYVTVLSDTFTRSGTGFMISPSLFMTNHHVIEDATQAAHAMVTFDKEIDEYGKDLPETVFRFDPDTFFITSPTEELDFTIVAIAARESGTLDAKDLRFFVLSDAPDKHVIGMNVNIIQHPLDMAKKISFRNNALTYRTNNSLLYETDTDLCSSGSPVCNDFWDLVAIHHWGSPNRAQKDEPDGEIPNAVNEGIRISAIYKYLNSKLDSLNGNDHDLLFEALSYSKTQPAVSKKTLSNTPPADVKTGNSNENKVQLNAAPDLNSNLFMTDSQTIKITIPIEISFRIGSIATGASTGERQPAATAIVKQLSDSPGITTGAEANKIDTDYSNRSGYDPGFIDGVRIPLPRIKTATHIAPLKATEKDHEKGILDYEHFSVVLNKTKRCAFFSATNIDGESYMSVDRKTGKVTPRKDMNADEGETWYNDPRVEPKYHLDQAFFSDWSHLFDRGHLTRRTDPSWGTKQIALRADADTFHFSNCSIQHFRFNESIPYWQGVEQYILETGLLKPGVNNRLSVFQGPVYNSKTDKWADDLQIPSRFFKVAIWKGAEGLKAVGLMVDQSQLLGEERQGGVSPKKVSSVNVSQWRVPVADIEKATDLDFGNTVRQADTIAQLAQPTPGAEAITKIPINDWDDLLK